MKHFAHKIAVSSAMVLATLATLSPVSADFLHPHHHPSKVRYYYDKDGTRHKCHNGTVGGIAGGVGGGVAGGAIIGGPVAVVGGAAAGALVGRSLERHGRHGC